MDLSELDLPRPILSTLSVILPPICMSEHCTDSHLLSRELTEKFVIFVVASDHSLDKGMAEAEGGGLEAIGKGKVDIRIVAIPVPLEPTRKSARIFEAGNKFKSSPFLA